MESISAQGTKHENKVIESPKRIIRLAKAATPSNYRLDLEEAVNETQFSNRAECAWFCGGFVLGVIRTAMRSAATVPLLFGEFCFLVLPLSIRSPRISLPSLAAFLASVFVLFRLRDAYSYPAEGEPADMFKDAVFATLPTVAFEVWLMLMAPRLALSLRELLFSVIGIILAAQWRMIYHREDPQDPVRRQFEKRKIATWHMNILLLAAAGPLTTTGVHAVPGGHLRDFTLGLLPPFFIMLAWRLKKNRWKKPTGRDPITIKNPDTQELEHQLRMLPVRDPDDRVHPDVIFEALFFLVLTYLPLLATWRWSSNSPLTGLTDWLQVGVNSVAWVLLLALWFQVKKLNEKLAADLRRAIHLKKLAGAA